MKLYNVIVDGIDSNDYPHFCDAFISYAEHEDGTELTEEELELINEDTGLVYDLVMESLY